MHAEFRHSDGGRKTADIDDRNDCTVRAVANATGCGYEKASSVLRDHGRKTGHGVKFNRVAQSVARSLGVTMKCVRHSGSLRRLLADFPQGTLIVRVRHHVFAVKDGVVFDSFPQSEHRSVRHAWLLNSSSS